MLKKIANTRTLTLINKLSINHVVNNNVILAAHTAILIIACGVLF